MLISVIIPVYNVDKYLDECLSSVVNQTYKNLEILCINDGSTDNSLYILEKYAKQDKHIKIINIKNRGPSYARNIALDMALGDIISFVDSDDYIDLNTYSLVVNCFKQDSTLDMVEFGYCEFFPNGEKVTTIPNINDTEIAKQLFYNKMPSVSFFVCTKCVKKELLQGVRFPEGRYYEDNLFNFQILQNTHNISYIQEPLYFYRQREGSITHEPLSDKVADTAITLDEYYEKETDEKIKKELSLYILCSIKNRTEYALYDFGIKGGLFYISIFNTYLQKYKSKGLSDLPFINGFYKMKLFLFCHFTKTYLYTFAIAAKIYKKIKALF